MSFSAPFPLVLQSFDEDIANSEKSKLTQKKFSLDSSFFLMCLDWIKAMNIILFSHLILPLSFPVTSIINSIAWLIMRLSSLSKTCLKKRNRLLRKFSSVATTPMTILILSFAERYRPRHYLIFYISITLTRLSSFLVAGQHFVHRSWTDHCAVDVSHWIAEKINSSLWPLWPRSMTSLLEPPSHAT